MKFTLRGALWADRESNWTKRTHFLLDSCSCAHKRRKRCRNGVRFFTRQGRQFPTGKPARVCQTSSSSRTLHSTSAYRPTTCLDSVTPKARMPVRKQRSNIPVCQKKPSSGCTSVWIISYATVKQCARKQELRTCILHRSWSPAVNSRNWSVV